MSDIRFVMLNRGVLALSGEEARSFLQGLISNDIDKVAPGRAIYAALLTPQGKCLFDFFIAEHDGRLLLDIEANRVTALAQRLTMYKLRAKVDIADVGADFSVIALLGPSLHDNLMIGESRGAAGVLGDGIVFLDPRLAALGARTILPKASAASTLQALGFEAGADEDYRQLPPQNRALAMSRPPML